MAFSRIVDAICLHYKDRSELDGFRAIAWENDKYDPEGKSEWTRFSVRETSSEQDTLGPVGGRKFLRRGVAVAQVFVPVNQRTSRLNDLASRIRGYFEGITIDAICRIHFNSVLLRTVGESNGFHQLNVEAGFFYHEVL